MGAPQRVGADEHITDSLLKQCIDQAQALVALAEKKWV
jgi:hypothetical protein